MKSKCEAAARGSITTLLTLRLLSWAELLLRAFQSHSIGKQAMTKSTQGSGKRQLQERNFEIVVNHITINENQLPWVSRESITGLKHVFGHNIKKYFRHLSPQAWQ